jgi:hypothetical protein
VRALAEARREALREQRQAAPLRPAILSDVPAGLGDSDLDRRDSAMLATLYMLALRRSELAEIDFEARGDGAEAGLGVLRMTEHGLELALLRSKAHEAPALQITRRAARQLPDLSTIIRVVPSSTEPGEAGHHRRRPPAQPARLCGPQPYTRPAQASRVLRPAESLSHPTGHCQAIRAFGAHCQDRTSHAGSCARRRISRAQGTSQQAGPRSPLKLRAIHRSI